MASSTRSGRRAPVAASHGAPGATPWTTTQLAGFAAALEADITRLREELAREGADLAALVDDSDGGDDQADAGSRTFEHEHELSVRANTREMLDQAIRARHRLAVGSYGLCESCGQQIAEGRLRAQPRATLCLACKQAQERR